MLEATLSDMTTDRPYHSQRKWLTSAGSRPWQAKKHRLTQTGSIKMVIKIAMQTVARQLHVAHNKLESIPIFKLAHMSSKSPMAS